MKGEIRTDAAISLDSASEQLSDLVDLEDKVTQMINAVTDFEQGHDTDVTLKTETQGDEDVLVVRIR